MLGRSTRSRTFQCLLLAAALGLCLYQLSAQDNAAATVISLSGQVSVLHDNYPQVLNLGLKIQPLQIVVTGPDGYAKFQVSDGSTFEVFPNSRATFRGNPPNWKDLLDVFIGRVKIHIEKFGGLPNHNRVSTPTAVISVRGTIFDVVVEDDEATTFVSVDEGEVAVEHKLLPSGVRILHPGESVRVFKYQQLAKQVDKGSVAQGALRAAAQALYELIYRTPRAGGGTPAGGGQPLPGDRGGNQGGGNAPPPPPPPPPPPAPPPK